MTTPTLPDCVDPREAELAEAGGWRRCLWEDSANLGIRTQKSGVNTLAKNKTFFSLLAHFPFTLSAFRFKCPAVSDLGLSCTVERNFTASSPTLRGRCSLQMLHSRF